MLSPVQLKDAGFYICRVNCGDSFEFSHWVQVDVLDVMSAYGKQPDCFPLVKDVLCLRISFQLAKLHTQNM